MSNLSKNNPQSSTLDLNQLNDKDLLDLAQSLKVLDDKKRYSLLDFVWDNYAKDARYWRHMAFWEAGKEYKERALIAGNRTGKTYTASAEVAYHATGRYPKDWKGRTFKEPTVIWSVGKTHVATRDILQKYLIGNRYDYGTGFLPKEDIVKINTKSGIPDAVLDIYVKHYTNGVEDGISSIHFKSYDQGVEAFMGAAVHVVHLDEEPSPASIYSECLTRTMTTNGIMMCTFTPLMGLSDVVLKFIPGGRFPEDGIGCANTE